MTKNSHLGAIMLVMICMANLSQGQVEVTGIFQDALNNQPIAYAHIINTRLGQGVITNEDGLFKMKVEEEDSLTISCVGYKKTTLACDYFKTQDVFLLQQSINELATVEIYSDYEFLIDLLLEAKKKLSKSRGMESKAYFILESNNKGRPVELIECYYNSTTTGHGIQDLKIKNGRIGMSPVDSSYFVSLSSTKIISDYDILSSVNNKFPHNPLHLSKKQILKNYDFSLLQASGENFQIGFEPKDDSDNYFKCELWIDKTNARLVDLELFASNLKRHPIVTIAENHQMDSLDFKLTYRFSDSGEEQVVDQIEFTYGFKYQDELGQKVMHSHGLFIFYAPDELFHLPYFDLSYGPSTDYDYIVSQPHNPNFWRFNELISPSERHKAYQEYFENNGVLLNFDPLKARHERLFTERMRDWSVDRIHLEDIRHLPLLNQRKDSRSIYRNFHAKTTISERYDLVTQIYLDYNIFDDSAYYNTRSLFDFGLSHYNLEHTEGIDVFINLYFDMVRMAELDLIKRLGRKPLDSEDVDEIYQSVMMELTTRLQQFKSDVRRGSDLDALQPYEELVEQALGIDNSGLIRYKEVNKVKYE